DPKLAALAGGGPVHAAGAGALPRLHGLAVPPVVLVRPDRLERRDRDQDLRRPGELRRIGGRRSLPVGAPQQSGLGRGRHGCAAGDRDGPGAAALEPTEGLHPLPDHLLPAPHPADRRHRHHLELDLQPHLRHPQHLAGRDRPRSGLPRLARRPRRRPLRRPHRRHLGRGRVRLRHPPGRPSKRLPRPAGGGDDRRRQRLATLQGRDGAAARQRAERGDGAAADRRLQRLRHHLRDDPGRAGQRHPDDGDHDLRRGLHPEPGRLRVRHLAGDDRDLPGRLGRLPAAARAGGGV
ncbi:MAG: hypothetical protein AVDCRST_MAG59-681, partial [uncultured Thermomicrobiales bacterium]